MPAWVKHFKDGNTSIKDEPRSGRPRTVSTDRNKERVDVLIREDRRITVGHSAMQEMIHRSRQPHHLLNKVK
ncbi:hypothetical protein C0J52_01249 [Blattella germanica]|nr:hypothetical protein C0J52_01249 [Blattella germanica]